MNNVAIRKATIEDLDQLQKVCISTFIETYGSVNTKENMKNYLSENFSTENLQKELTDENTVFYLSILEGEIIGYLKLNFGPSQTDIKDEKAIEIERIYVSKAFQRLGIGKLFYDKTLDVAKEKRLDYIWLGVWEKNPKAIKFYEKNGFAEFDKHVFMLGDDKQTDIMMKLQLNGCT